MSATTTPATETLRAASAQGTLYMDESGGYWMVPADARTSVLFGHAAVEAHRYIKSRDAFSKSTGTIERRFLTLI